LIVGPHQRFPFVETIRLERVVMLLCWASLFISGKFKIRFSSVSALILIFYLWLMLSYLISPYRYTPLPQDWVENYWKLIVLYFLIFFAIQNLKDFYVLSVGIVLILFTYQAYSWIDFLRGGNYVYQQGMKRIVGIWTSGLGAPNYFGMLSMLSLPFAYFWYNLAENKIARILVICHFIISFLSIVYSGTRGALLGIVVFIFLNMRNIKRVIYLSVILIILVSITYMLLPEHLKYRYFGMIMPDKFSEQVDADTEEMQRMSAYSRLEGLIDGWKLAMLKPMTGYGPGSSARARYRVNPELKFIWDDYVQLHNLYGQILAESGIVGALIFLSILILFFFQLRTLMEYTENYPFFRHFVIFVKNFMLLMLFYGMISHTLYRHYWFIIFAMHGALVSIARYDTDQFALETDDNSRNEIDFPHISAMRKE
jgi:O-antigen ligase